MGAALRTANGNAVAYVFYRRVRAEADRYEVSTGPVLACAIAHELGHCCSRRGRTRRPA